MEHGKKLFGGGYTSRELQLMKGNLIHSLTLKRRRSGMALLILQCMASSGMGICSSKRDIGLDSATGNILRRRHISTLAHVMPTTPLAMSKASDKRALSRNFNHPPNGTCASTRL